MHGQQNIECWNALHEGTGLSEALGENIYSSWKRSEANSIDYPRAMPKELSADEFERIKKSYKRLMICADWVINYFIANSVEEDVEILLFSRDGDLLRVYSKSNERNLLAKNGVKAGTKWSEEHIGANVFTLGLRYKQVFELPGYLNYCRFLVDGYYYYCPISLSDGELCGSIVAAVPALKSSPHLRSIVMTLARTIELDMFLFHNGAVTNESKTAQKYAKNSAKYSFDDVIGESEPVLEMKKRAMIASQSSSNILIHGESGVGKDVLAQAIHNSSKQSRQPYVAINCAAFSKELIASELFGYESGAFTGAKREGSIGKFEIANRGTLFLDEIGDMPMEAQSMLLRVLEEKSFRKVGGNKLIEVDVRIIAATNKNLRDLISQKLFREDLFYRLSIIRISVPPLRHRGEDVHLLAHYFIKELCAKMGRPEIRLTESALDFLRRYSWPGNIRELRNLLEGIISTQEETLIGVRDIQSYLEDCFGERVQPEYAAEVKAESSAALYAYGSAGIEKFKAALKHCRNNKTKAAEYLGLSRSTFYRRMKEFGLD